MTGHFATTPFGGGRVSVAIFQKNQEMDRQRAVLSKAPKQDSCVGKWQLIRDLSEARAAFELSDRTITVLEALLSFHQQAELDGRKPIIVFPSNAELSVRSRGMAPATLRRHIAALVDAELIQRRDSPNGKRYCRRNGQGAIESAFGFDLSPLVLAAPKIRHAAEQLRQEKRLCQNLRSELTLLSRDIEKLLEAAKADMLRGKWGSYEETYQPLTIRLSRRAPAGELEKRRDELKNLLLKIETAYENSIESQKVSANDACNERHYKNPKPESHKNKIKNNNLKTNDVLINSNKLLDIENMNEINKEHKSNINQLISISYITNLCPDIILYSKTGINNWKELIIASDVVRRMTGISDKTWQISQQVIGNTVSAIVMAAILQRIDTIKSPGAYLNSLIQQAQHKKFSVMNILQSLDSRAEK